MAGALAGASFGLIAIPEQWRDVEDGARLLSLAEALWTRHDRRQN